MILKGLKILLSHSKSRFNVKKRESGPLCPEIFMPLSQGFSNAEVDAGSVYICHCTQKIVTSSEFVVGQQIEILGFIDILLI